MTHMPSLLLGGPPWDPSELLAVGWPILCLLRASAPSRAMATRRRLHLQGRGGTVSLPTNSPVGFIREAAEHVDDREGVFPVPFSLPALLIGMLKIRYVFFALAPCWH